MKTWRIFFLTLLTAIFLPSMAWAGEAAAIDTGDTTFIIISSALVMLMTPGLALFYGGMVRRKNVLSTMMHSFIIIAIISVQWVLIGYTIAFGPDKFHLFGDLTNLFFKGVGMEPSSTYGVTVPNGIFAMFQLMFAIITPALISGSIAERMRFPAFIAFIVLWATFIYDPLAHWVWAADGWLFNLGALDFAGGTVVHISSGVSGLVAALVLGRRKGFGKEPMLPHHLPMTVLGAALLWFGWFGFNAGSALSANGLAANAFVVTNTSAAAAALSWMIVEWIHHRRPTILGVVSGAVAGLVAITPAAGFVTPMAALIIGFVGGAVCYLGVSVLKAKLGYDDALDAFGCHGIGGTWGAIATGLFATTAVNPAAANGLFYGNPGLLKAQLIGVVATYLFAGVGTLVILKVVNLFTRIRATEEEELSGLDSTMHGEEAYRDLALTGTLGRSPVKEQMAEAPLSVKGGNLA